MRRSDGFVVYARSTGPPFWWPFCYRRLQIEPGGLLLRGWPIAWSRPDRIAKEQIGYFVWDEIAHRPFLALKIYDSDGRPIRNDICVLGNYEKLAAELTGAGYQFGEN